MEDIKSPISVEVNMDPNVDIDIATVDGEFNYTLENNLDCTDVFNTNEVFPTREDLLSWARSAAFELGFVIVIIRSDTYTGQKGRRTYVLLGCEKTGKYRAYKKNSDRTFPGTRKCGCPFKLKGTPVYNGEGWKLMVICGSHNHPLAKSLEGHPFAGRLNCKEKTMLSDMTKSMVKPKNILLSLKEHNEKNVSTIKQVYNARYAYRSQSRRSGDELQHLMKLLERDMYIHSHRVRETEDVICDVFWAHPDGVKLLNAFPFVLVIDKICKTNRCRLPLLEIVGMTPTGMTFSVAFAFIEFERVNNFIWILERLRGLILRDDALPNVIITYKDQALMSAVKTVFPNSYNLLCRFHIKKNVKARVKMYVQPKESWDIVMDAWGSIIDCPNVACFDEHMMRFEAFCSAWPMFVDYVKDTWLTHHKEKFVKAWTDQVMHFGSITTNRVETEHSTLKSFLQNSIGDLCNAWDAINNMITLQHTEIKESFEHNIHVVNHNFNVTLYKHLQGMISTYALCHIAEEYDRLKFVGVDKSQCGCVVRRTHGLPCACELARYVSVGIPLDSIHMFWRMLSQSDHAVLEMDISVEQEIADILKRFDEVDFCEKIMIKSRLREIAYPNMTSMCPLADKVVTIHPFMHQFIDNVVHVKLDGHCGYRIVAALLGMGEESWPLVKVNLLKEMNQWRDEYIILVGGVDKFEMLKQSLLVDSLAEAPMDKWMNITYMGYVIASRYNIILVSLSLQQSMTFFPLRTPPRDSSFHRLVCIGHVNENHFVQVNLKDGAPIPPTALLWSSYCYPEARGWETTYLRRMQQYSNLIGLTDKTINLGDH